MSTTGSTPGSATARRTRVPRVAVVTQHWGSRADELTETTRLVAGALARHATVDVVHLLAPPEPPRTSADSVFGVHQVPLHGAHPLRASILRAALGTYDRGRNVPRRAATILHDLEGSAPDVPDVLARLAPDAVVLAGHHQPWDVGTLGVRGAIGSPRVVLLPYTAEGSILRSGPVSRLLARADAAGAAHSGERRALEVATAGTVDARRLGLGVGVNRSAAANRLFGVRFFGAYVLIIRSFPPGGARWERSVTHDVLRSTLGDISVAEIDGDTWRIGDKENTLELPVSPSRVNLWRLMAHAIATVDLRPPGPVGRETIDSLLLGTPVVVPEGSAAHEHAADAGGGLWYRNDGELIDSVRALSDRRLRDRLAVQGKLWADRNHGDMDDFVERVRDLVLGDRRSAS